MDPSWENAVKRGDVSTVRDLLARGLDVDARDGHGQTGLMLAARAGHDAVVEALLAHKPDLDVTAKFGLSALMLAVVAGHAAIARRLAAAGADLTLKGSGAPGFANKTAADLATAHGMHELATHITPEDAR